MANLKGGNAIVRLLLAHGEKIGIGAVAVCAGMLFWSAIKNDHLGPDQQPDKLVELASQASRHVEEFTWEGLDPNSRLTAKPVSGQAMAPIASEHFPPIEEPWTRPVLAPMSLRTDPELLAAEDIEVYGDSGMWASADPEVIKQKMLENIKEQQRLDREDQATREREEADDDRGDRRERGDRRGRGDGRRGGGRGGNLFGDDRGGREESDAPARNDGPVVVDSGTRIPLQGFEEISAKSWVTVVAKVPIEKQFKQYDASLMSASGYNAEQDIPFYRGYIVERAEVTDAGLGEWQRIASINDLILDKTTSEYPFEPTELVSERYTHPLLTHPLPPLVLRDWDRRVTHSTIPLEEEDLEDETMEPEVIEEGEEALEGDDIFSAAARSRDDRFAGERIDGHPGSGRRQSSMPRGEMESESDGRRGPSRRGEAGMSSWDGETPFALFRYFDDKVKPGHRYRYRVRLALADVNHEVPEQFLDKTVTERRGKIEKEALKAFRLTKWSEPSPVASVPHPARIYVVNAETANPANFYAEPEARILVQAFNSQLPAEIAMEDSFLRGSVLNVHSKANVIWVGRSELKPGDEDQEFDFQTGITVLDFRGGEKLGDNRDLTAPARAVLMDPSGRLFLQSELDDSERVENYQRALEGGEDDRGGFERRRGGNEFRGESEG